MPDTDLIPVPGFDAPKEPLIQVAAITAFVVAGIAVLVSFGLPVTDDQQAAILGFIAPAAVIITALWSRRRVWSPASVRRVVHRELAAARNARRAMPYTPVAEVIDPGAAP